MVSMRLPNIRRMFVPDPGYTIVDADLAGADAQVVAWEAGDEDLKDAFRKGIKIHVHNARSIWPHETKDMDTEDIKKSKFYPQAKRGCHAVNYGATAPSLVFNNGWTQSFAEMFIERWFTLHPKIKDWHVRVDNYLRGLQCWNCNALNESLTPTCKECGEVVGRTIKNGFGFRRRYFERYDSNMLNAALAWGPQSTVALCTDLGWTSVAHGPDYEMLTTFGEMQQFSTAEYLVNPELSKHYRDAGFIKFLIQVHDSIVFQVPHSKEAEIPSIIKAFQVRVPYTDPLVIGMAYKSSRKSWGDC